jgi:hypothetical protein
VSFETAEAHGITYVIRTDAKPDMPGGYVRKDELQAAIEQYILKTITKFNGEKFLDFGMMAEGLFDRLVTAKAITIREAGIAGIYYKFESSAFTNFRANFLKSNPIHKIASEIGDRYYRDVFQAIERAAAEGRPLPPSLNLTEEALPSQGNVEGADPKPATAPNPDFFRSEARRSTFVAKVNTSLKEIEKADLSNAEKSQAQGYLVAAKALSEIPDPPVDLIWTILTRANSVAGIASFFVALIALIAMVG